MKALSVLLLITSLLTLGAAEGTSLTNANLAKIANALEASSKGKAAGEKVVAVVSIEIVDENGNQKFVMVRATSVAGSDAGLSIAPIGSAASKYVQPTSFASSSVKTAKDNPSATAVAAGMAAASPKSKAGRGASQYAGAAAAAGVGAAASQGVSGGVATGVAGAVAVAAAVGAAVQSSSYKPYIPTPTVTPGQNTTRVIETTVSGVGN